MKLILTGGFLGSGKTTAIQRSCNLLSKENVRVAVITNDQGEDLVDSKFLQNFSIPVKEVTNGCFCCNYNSLLENINYFSETINPQMVFAESVGSCTDLVATIAKPLAEIHPGVSVNISVFVDSYLLYSLISGKSSFINDSVRYIFKKQMEEADVLVLNKTDLLGPKQLEEIQELINHEYPFKKILLQNSLLNMDIEKWIDCLRKEEFLPKESLDLDYRIYGAGEAELAWLDAVLVINTKKIVALKAATSLAEAVYEKIKIQGYIIGHLKYLIDDGDKQYKISYTTTSKTKKFFISGTSRKVAVLINARVETNPEILKRIVYSTMDEISLKANCKIQVRSISAFKPGFPMPTHRIGN